MATDLIYKNSDGEEFWESDLEKEFEEFWDEIYPAHKMGEQEFLSSRILKECDPVSYSCEFGNWCDSRGLE